MANLLAVTEGDNFGRRVWISFHVDMFIIFDFAPESIKKSISSSGDLKFLHFVLSKRSGIVQIFIFRWLYFFRRVLIYANHT